MLRKLWKHSSFMMEIFCLIVIIGLICTLGCEGTQKNEEEETVKIYRGTEPAKKDTAVTADSLLHQAIPETAEVDISEEPVPSLSEDEVSKNANPSEALGEFAQQLSTTDVSKQTDEESARAKAERLNKIEEAQSLIRETQQQRDDLFGHLNRLIEKDDQRQYALAKKLNSLSVEKQQAYFEDYRSQLPAAKEFIRSTLFENARTEAGSQEYSGQMEKIISQIVQTIQETPDEERVKQHIEKLREYGFEPKF